MIDRTGLLAKDIVGNLIGVIDLKRGQAVHGIAGNRANYQAVQFGSDPSHFGDAIALAKHYQNLGLRRLYVADLDAIGCQAPQSDLLTQIIQQCHDWDEILLDIGWTGTLSGKLSGKPSGEPSVKLPRSALDSPNVGFIAATECAQSPDALSRLVQAVTAGRTLLGLDYRAGEFVSDVATEQQWHDAAKRLKVKRCVVLDVASVGTGDSSNSVEACRVTRQHLSDATIYSGGGIRSVDDLQRFATVGCDGFLVATCLQ